MNYTIVRSTDAFEKLTEEWNSLLDDSAIHVPFLRHEYMTSWWRHIGGGEWHDAELFVVLGRDEERLVGIAPLFLTRNKEGLPVFMFIGSVEISDYLDIIVRPEDLSAFVSGLLAFLDGLEEPNWRGLDWVNLLEYTPTLPALRLAAEQMGWEFSQERLQPAPSIALAADWDTYLAGIDKKQRHEIRRKIRRAETNEPPARWYIVQDAAALDQELEAFFDLMRFDADKAGFLTPAMCAQMQDIVHATFSAGWMRIAFLEVGGQKIAGYIFFDYGDHFWIYNSGIHPDFSALSPGWVLLGYLIEYAIHEHKTGFDFMRGNELYKYRFGAQDRFVTRALITRK